MTLIFERPPTQPTRPRSSWWRLRPGERRLLLRLLAVGAPLGLMAGALAGIFLTGPGPALPARAAPLATVPSTSHSSAHPAPTSATGPALAARSTRAATSAPVSASSPPGRAPVAAAPTSTTRAYWANCTQAREAGAVDIPAGSPGYRVGLDRDRDGFGCDSSGETPREVEEPVDEPDRSEESAPDDEPVVDEPEKPIEPEEWRPAPRGPRTDA